MSGSRYGLQIRAATAADARGLATLFGTAGITVDARVLEARVEAFRSAAGTLLIAEEWGPPSGIVSLSWAPTLASDRPVARIDVLLVAPEDRRRGIARLLLKAASQAARTAGCGDLVLAAEGSDLEAFCRATGFDPLDRLFRRSLRKRT